MRGKKKKGREINKESRKREQGQRHLEKKEIGRRGKGEIEWKKK